MLSFRHKGNFENTENYFSRLGKGDFYKGLELIGQAGVDALRAATPKDTGKTAKSWSYEIRKGKDGVTISWNNSNFNNGVPVALMIQYGHGMPNGVYVKGIDYINPALQPIFDELEKKVWGEVIRNV